MCSIRRREADACKCGCDLIGRHAHLSRSRGGVVGIVKGKEGIPYFGLLNRVAKQCLKEEVPMLKAVTSSGARFGPVGHELNLRKIAGLLTLASSGAGALSVVGWLNRSKLRSGYCEINDDPEQELARYVRKT
jgi:hypothetical protein